MKTSACYAALLALALCLPAQAGTLTAYTNNFDDPATTAAGVIAEMNTGGYVVAFPLTVNSYGDWDGKRLFNITRDASVFTLSNLPTHTGISASFILGFLGSWDSLDGDTGLAPDYLDVLLDGAFAARLTYNNVSGTVKETGGGTVLAEYDTSFCCAGFPQTIVDMSTAGFLTFAHTASTFTLSIQAGGAGFTGGSDEEWGLDGLRINLTGAAVPEPATWSLMIAGFGLVGGSLRRRRAAGCLAV